MLHIARSPLSTKRLDFSLNLSNAKSRWMIVLARLPRALLNAIRMGVFSVATVLSSGSAEALCILGMGSSCGISDSTAGELIGAQIDGKFTGDMLQLPIRLATQAYAPLQTPPPDVVQRVQKALDLIQGQSTENCQETCKLVRNVIKRGLMTAQVGPGDRFEVTVQLHPTPAGEALIKSTLLKGNKEILYLGTHVVKFKRVLRTQEEAFAGEHVTHVEFEYQIIPNTWANVEKLLDQDSLPATIGTGAASFQKWSDGWRLAAGLHL